jgi:hypothetical protein
MGISITVSTSFKVFSITQSTSFQNITAIQFPDLQTYSHSGTEFFVSSAATISSHISRTSFIASIVKSNCLSQTVFSAQSEVLQTFGLSTGDGVYQTIRTSRQSESAVRIIFQTL